MLLSPNIIRSAVKGPNTSLIELCALPARGFDACRGEGGEIYSPEVPKPKWSRNRGATRAGRVKRMRLIAREGMPCKAIGESVISNQRMWSGAVEVAEWNLHDGTRVTVASVGCCRGIAYYISHHVSRQHPVWGKMLHLGMGGRTSVFDSPC